MLSIVPIKNAKDAREYFEHDNYYAKDSVINKWWGKGAELLGLKGEVKLDDFESLLRGKIPGGLQIGKKTAKGFDHRPGYDLTFSAPKSVSILAEITGDKKLLRAHDEAVKEALSYLEKHVVETRVLENGEKKFQKVDNVAVATFRHGTARAVDDKSLPDPDTHTHAVVLNAVMRKDGKWRSISSENMFEHKMCLGMIYRNAYARRLLRMGHEIEKTHPDGRFEIKSISREQVEKFSKRMMQIEKKKEELGVSGAAISREISKTTRQSKKDFDSATLKKDWLKQAKEVSLDVEKLIKSANTRQRSTIKTSVNSAVKFGMQHLQQSDSVFTRAALINNTLSQIVGKHSLKDVLKEIHKHEISGELVKCGYDHFTTKYALNLEKNNIELMKSMQGKADEIANKAEVIKAKNTIKIRTGHEKASESQQLAVTKIFLSKDRVVGVNGIAGAGKTTMIKAVFNAAQTKNYTIIGLAPQSSQALTLADETNVKTENLSLFLTKNASNAPDNSKRLIVLDEAGLASSKQINQLLHYVKSRKNTHLIMLGDIKQLPSIEAGAAFGQLIKNGMQTSQMKITQRQKTKSLEGAVYGALAGLIEDAFDKLGSSIKEIECQDQRLKDLSNDFLERSKSVRSRSIVLTSTNQDRQTLNKLIRDGLQNERTLTGKKYKTKILIGKKLSKAQLLDSYNYSAGNIIRFNENYKRFGIKRGEYFNIKNADHSSQTITFSSGTQDKVVSVFDISKMKAGAIELYSLEDRELQKGDEIRFSRNIDQKNNIVTSSIAKVTSVTDQYAKVRLENKKIVSLNFNDPLYKHWDYAFSSTVHSAQGKTADYVIANLDSKQSMLTNQAAFYVIISRARYESVLYTDSISQTKSALERKTGAKITAIDGKENLSFRHDSKTNTHQHVVKSNYQNNDLLSKNIPKDFSHER